MVDYRYPRRLVPADGQALVKQMDRFVERRGEPMLSEFSPEEFAAGMERAGFEETGIASRPKEQVRRYLQGRYEHTTPATQFRFRLVPKERTVGRRARVRVGELYEGVG